MNLFNPYTTVLDVRPNWLLRSVYITYFSGAILSFIWLMVVASWYTRDRLSASLGEGWALNQWVNLGVIVAALGFGCIVKQAPFARVDWARFGLFLVAVALWGATLQATQAEQGANGFALAHCVVALLAFSWKSPPDPVMSDQDDD